MKKYSGICILLCMVGLLQGQRSISMLLLDEKNTYVQQNDVNEVKLTVYSPDTATLIYSESFFNPKITNGIVNLQIGEGVSQANYADTISRYYNFLPPEKRPDAESFLMIKLEVNRKTASPIKFFSKLKFNTPLPLSKGTAAKGSYLSDVELIMRSNTVGSDSLFNPDFFRGKEIDEVRSKISASLAGFYKQDMGSMIRAGSFTVGNFQGNSIKPAISQITHRGLFATREGISATYSIDGVSLEDKIIPVKAVLTPDKVEIIKGGVTTLMGTDAGIGVINLTTKSKTFIHDGGFNLEWDNKKIWNVNQFGLYFNPEPGKSATLDKDMFGQYDLTNKFKTEISAAYVNQDREDYSLFSNPEDGITSTRKSTSQSFNFKFNSAYLLKSNNRFFEISDLKLEYAPKFNNKFLVNDDFASFLDNNGTNKTEIGPGTFNLTGPDHSTRFGLGYSIFTRTSSNEKTEIRPNFYELTGNNGRTVLNGGSGIFYDPTFTKNTEVASPGIKVSDNDMKSEFRKDGLEFKNSSATAQYNLTNGLSFSTPMMGFKLGMEFSGYFGNRTIVTNPDGLLFTNQGTGQSLSVGPSNFSSKIANDEVWGIGTAGIRYQPAGTGISQNWLPAYQSILDMNSKREIRSFPNGFLGYLDSKEIISFGFGTTGNPINVWRRPNGNFLSTFGMNVSNASDQRWFNSLGLAYMIHTSVGGSNGERPYTLYSQDGINPKISLYIDDMGRGIIIATIKNFKMDHPQKPDQDIVYASLEGPEAAAYCRGKGQLIQGKLFVAFPEHFTLVCAPEEMTIQLTPKSSKSRGLAVTSIHGNGFEVEELMEGKGSYEFFWEAKGIRKGFENYQVIRPKNHVLPTEFVSPVMNKN